MGWKSINGRRYFYKCERRGDRVKTAYFGAGTDGRLMARVVAFERSEREANRERLREEREETATEERASSRWFDDVQAVANVAMIAAGYHRRKGEWRKRR